MKKKIIGARIAELRVKRGISTSTLAQAINKSQATISRIENGKQSINLSLLAKIAKILKIHPLSLLSGEHYHSDNKSVKCSCFELIMKTARENANISIEEIAGEIQQDNEYIENIENGHILPSESELEIMARKYDLNILICKELYYFELHSPNLSKIVSEILNDFTTYLNSKLTGKNKSNLNMEESKTHKSILDFFHIYNK